MNNFIEISGRKIGYDYEPLVIAEIGINHDGNLDIAVSMVDAAIEAGVEVIKHQTHIADEEMSFEAKKIIPVHTNESIFDIIEKCALNEKDELALKNYVESRGKIFISTPFSRAAANRLEKIGVPAYKIGSGECNNYPLIEHIASFGKPIILSTGMNDINSIRKSVNILENHNIEYALLHCTNIYPTPPNLVRLGAITEMIEEFPNAVIGLSDHTSSNLPSFGAVALGASIIERHFTDTMGRNGPDIPNSMDLRTCIDLIEGVNILRQARGGNKAPVKEEIPTMKFAFASVVTTKPISKGEILSEDNLWVKRPGIGPLFASDYKSLIGKVCKKNLKKDHHIDLSEIE